MWSLPEWMPSDIRHALRRLSRTPAFTAFIVATLAVGIAASTLMFSVVRAVLHHSMGMSAPDRLVVSWPTTGGTAGEWAYNAQADFAQAMTATDGIAFAGSTHWPADLIVGSNKPIRVMGTAVSGSFFDVLGARPLLGRTLRHDEDVPGAKPVVVLSQALWTRVFHADPGVIGRTTGIREKSVTHAFEIVGVMPADFSYPAGSDYWTQAATTLARLGGNDARATADILEGVGVFHAVARLGRETTVEQFQADLTRVRRATSKLPETEVARLGVGVTPLIDHVVGRARQALPLLMGAVLIVLLTATANVAGLLIAKGASRSTVFAVSAALGATRMRLVRQLFVEGVLVASLGAMVGIAGAHMALTALVALSPVEIPRLQSASIDQGVLLFAVGITSIVALLLTLLPAWQLRSWCGPSALGGGSKGIASLQGTGGRRLLVISQVAAGVVFLVAAGLMGRSFVRLSNVNLGFDTDQVLTFEVVGLNEARYPTERQRRQVVEQLIDRFAAVPGVDAVGAVSSRPFAHGSIGYDTALLIEGQTDLPTGDVKNPVANFEAVTPDYFRAMGIRLAKGRAFTRLDVDNAPPVAIISEPLASALWPDHDAVGKRILESFLGSGDGSKPLQWRTVVGVVGAAHYREIDRARLDIYVPVSQATGFDPEHFVLRSSVAPSSLAAMAADAASAVDSELSIDRPVTMADVVSRLRGPWQVNVWVFTAFGALGLALAAIGLFGLVAYTVALRRREVGVRVALGASRRQVVTLFVGQGARLVTIGLVVGIAIAGLGSRLLSSLLFNVDPMDVPTFMAAAGLVAGVALVACYVPARRAASIDPASLFRSDAS